MTESISLFQYGYTVLMYFILVFVWNQLLQPRYKGRTALAIVIVACAIYIFLSVFTMILPRYNLFRMFSPIVLLIILVFILYKTPWYQNILAFALAFLCITIPEVILPTLFMTSEEVLAGVAALHAERQAFLFGLCLLMNFISLTILCVGWKTIQKQQLWAIPGKIWLLYTLLPLSQLYLLLEISASEAYLSLKMVPVLIALLLSLGADIALLNLIRHTADYAVMSMANKMQEQAIQAQKKYFEELTHQYDQTRKMRHDINNHIFTIKALLDSGEVNGAKEYLSSVEEIQSRERKAYLCGNMLVSTFLNAKAESMLKAGIQFNCQADLPAELHVTDLDLITALGNLCDNAQEAAVASGVDKPTVNMTLCIKNGFFAVMVNNPSPAKNEPKERRIPELERGVGSSILKELATKYEGEYTIETENGLCNVSLFLKV